MNKRGGQLTYTPELAAEICARLAEGESLRSICKTEGYPPASTVRGWVVADVEGFAEQYARARDTGLDAMAEELLDIADDSSQDTTIGKRGDEIMDAEYVARSKLRVEARKWYLSKLAPKRYGDSQRVEVEGTVDIALAITAARKRLNGG